MKIGNSSKSSICLFNNNDNTLCPKCGIGKLIKKYSDDTYICTNCKRHIIPMYKRRFK